MNQFRLYLSVVLCAVATYCCAQERRPFVGEIMYTSMQINTGVINGTKFDYDGKHEIRTVYRNHDKHEYDVRLHYHRIFLVSQNRCIFYSDETKTGVEFPLVKYFEIGRSNEALGYKNGNSIKETGKSGEVQGYPCEIFEGKTFSSYKEKMDQNNDVTRELWVSTEFEPDSVSNGSNREFKVQGFVMKDVMTRKYKARDVFTSKGSSYVSGTATSIEEREVEDSEFEVPSDIKIEKFRTFWSAYDTLAKMNRDSMKSLKKKGQYPTQLPDNDTFELDQEWE